MRIVTTYLAPLLGQPLINDNRPGAGGLLAAQTVSKSVADGYTLLSATTGGHIARVHLVKGTPLDLFKDLTPIAGIGDTPIVLVGHPLVPANSMQALIDFAKANPGKLTYGTSGIGSTSHLTAEQLKMVTGAEIVHVPYKSGAQALTDVVGGQLPLSYAILTSVLRYIQSGKLKAFATTNGGRAVELPAVPFIEELVPGFNALQSLVALFGPPNLPAPITRRLNADALRAVMIPEAKLKIEEAGFVIVTGSPEQFAENLKRQIEVVGKIVKAANIQSTD